MKIQSTTTLRAVRRYATAAGLTVLAVPLATHAGTDRALDACVKAFVAANLPQEQPVRVEKRASAVSPFGSFNYTYRFVLTATGATSGKQLAQATCVVDRTGEIISLEGQPAQVQIADASKSQGREISTH